MEKTKDLQKKELIFRILDDLKNAGEKINADKVAKLAQMGKQTVLPHYNEWRFLSDSQKQEGNELPGDLVRALQRLLIQWKQDISVELNDYKNQAEQENEQLKAEISTLRVENNRNAEHLADTQQENLALKQALSESQQFVLEKEQDIKQFQLNIENQRETIADLERRLEQTKEEYENQLGVQESKLDQQHKLQIDHWLQALDEERQQKQVVVKEQQAIRAELLASEKEKGSLQNQVEHKSQAYIEACQERNELRQELRSQKPSQALLAKILLLLDAEESEALAKAKQLIAAEQKYQQGEEEIKKKNEKIQRLEDRMSDLRRQEQSIQALKLELEKSRGFALALEKTLGKPQKDG